MWTKWKAHRRVGAETGLLGWPLQDAWGRTALHWAAAYACEATVVLLVVRGAHPGPHSHAGEAVPPATPADMAAAAGHGGIAAFLAQQHLLQLLKENNIPLEDPSGGGPSLGLRCFPMECLLS